MYKMILVDDSERVRNGLKMSMDWPKHQIEIVGEAEDGLEAMELIRDKKPDLIISDVLMPHMNGLELTERALSIVPHAKVILLSGYDNFPYVQTAIRNGAFDYLLKPSRIEELFAIIEKAKQSLEQEKGQIKDVVQLRQQLLQSIPVLKERYLRYLLTGQMSLLEIRKKCDYLNLSIGSHLFTCLVLEIDDEDAVAESARIRDNQLLLFAFRNIVEELLREQLFAEIIENYDNQLIMVVSREESQDSKPYLELLQAIARKIQYYIRTYYKVSVSIGIGGIYHEPEWLPESNKEAAEAVQYRLYMGKGSVIYISDVGYKASQEHAMYPYDLEKKLCMALKIGDIHGADGLAKQFLRVVVDDLTPTPDHLHKICLQLVYTLQRKLIEWDISAGSILEIAALDEQIKKRKTINQLEMWLLQYINEFAQGIEKNMQQRNVSIVQKAILFMESHYSQDISLQDVAEAVYLTPNYFANLFKERTAETVLNFLADIRINKAKQLLKQSDLKLSDISGQVGYTDAKYFGQVFRKRVGVTPLEYRKM
jgi:two-component system response regulator YesN